MYGDSHSCPPFPALLATTLLAWVVAAPASAADSSIRVRGGVVDVRFEAISYAVPQSALLSWIRTAAESVAEYYDGFPVPRVRLQVRASSRGRVRGGRMIPGEPRIQITVGGDTTPADLAADWVLPHEMVHLGLPDLARQHAWASEGLATYVEPIARVRAGALHREKIWEDLLSGLPKGVQSRSRLALDADSSWGARYWGGALFWLLADLEIRRATQNRLGLEHALRAVVRAGGNATTRWRFERVLSVGDDAVGHPVLRQLYERMGERPFAVDLDELWSCLGVSSAGGEIHYDDDAPLAAIREAIMVSPGAVGPPIAAGQLSRCSWTPGS